MNRAISPPPARRRKTTTTKSTATPKSSQKTTSSINSTFLPPLGTNTLRIFSWNINGTSPFLQPSITSFFKAPKNGSKEDSKDETYLASLRIFLHRQQWPSIIFLQEVKIASKDIKTQDADSLYDAHFTLPTNSHNARGPWRSGKLYGDREGRVSIVELTCRATLSKLAIFNIYAVNGTENLYHDTRTGAVRGTRHDRKREFHHVLLAGDMNVAPDERDGYPKLRVFPRDHVVNRANFHDMLLEGSGEEKEYVGLNDVDIWRKMHEQERRYTYYPRNTEWGTSCDRVDYFMAVRRLWEMGCVKACGIMNSEAERGPSDHVPIWADIELKLDTK
ncbi:hypothetical protein COCVIDRAFT_37152 [Bipolaris victoriae FI3]|uniref:Endonuclease/exonuclease/phosphatase domain-containing protein n=1 Tax=Bipolaris victoriae (strain FI3) TaxID=930091 RepID=W7ELN7_BIPV3|nr:hypothetical protein COCVIDRAFT_37152 [Bipolaris victoriae FI3]